MSFHREQGLNMVGALMLIMLSSRAEIFVAPDGADSNPGTAAHPFRTLERARDEIRTLKKADAFPEDGVTVMIRPGEYPVQRTFQLTAEDSGAPSSPVVYRAAGPEAPRFTGGVRLRRFTPVDDPAVLGRLQESARGRVWETDLAAAGVHDIPPFELGGFSSGRGFRTHPAMELFVNDEPMVWARWPNDGFVKTGEVPGPLTLKSWDNRPGAPHGRFRFEGDRPERWVGEPDAWLYGYWYWNWADSYERIERIDLEQREIILAEPWHHYGYREGQRYYALNLMCELDMPGEWYLDRERGKVYVYPKTDLNNATVELSVAAFPLMEIEGAAHLRFQGLLWECGAADGVRIRGGADCRIEGCTIRKMAGNAVEIQGGRRHAVHSCDIHTMGRGGIVLNGGDRKTLEAGEHLVENCHIHDLSRIDHAYTPAVLVNGAGNRIRHNYIHDVPSSAMRVNGNDHLVEFNEVHRVVLESDDQGAVDMWGDATYRGNVFRYNYWHHLGNWVRKGEEASRERAGIRLDDAISGVLILGNVFHRCCATPTHFGAVQIHGGKENVIEGNLFVECGAVVSFTPWGDKRWRDFVASALDDPAIDRERYMERYPLLANLEGGHDVNTIRANAVLRCDQLFLRAPDNTESVDNREHPESTAFPEGPDGRLVWSKDDAEMYGVADIPFEKIGLYKDAWRSRRGADLVLR